MPILDPERLAPVALPELNDEHADQARRLDAAVDALDALAAGRGDAAAVVAAVDSYYAFSRDHFLREEERLRASGYPELESHQAEHERALEELDAEERRFRDEGDGVGLREFLVTRHAPWLERHIAGLDAHAAQYLAEWA